MKYATYVINLDRSPARLTFMKGQLDNLGIAFHRVNAIDGKIFKFDEIYDEKLWTEHNGSPGTLGERGCALSHRIALQHMLDEGQDYALILEDDIELNPRFKEILEMELTRRDSGKEDWEYLSFNYPSTGWKSIHLWLFMFFNMTKARKSELGFLAKLPLYVVKFFIVSPLYLLEGARENIYMYFYPLGKAAKFYRTLYLAGCYVVTRSGAKKLISLNTPISYTADALPNEAKKLRKLKFSAHIPLVARQKREEFESILNPELHKQYKNNKAVNY